MLNSSLLNPIECKAIRFLRKTQCESAFSVPSGTYNSVQMVTISDTTPNAWFEYSVNLPGDANLYFRYYSGPINVSNTETLTVIAMADGYNTSARATATYTIPPDFTVAINPASLSVLAGQSGTATITMQDEDGFNSNVSFASRGFPPGQRAVSSCRQLRRPQASLTRR